jgi:hypothetical protein
VRNSMNRLLQAVRFEREAFVWMDLNDRATGDALVLVIVTRVLLLLGFGFSILGLTTSLGGLELVLTSMINTAVFWLAYSGLVYAASRFLFNGEGSYATTLRITGFAFPTLLLLIFTENVISNGALAFIVGSAWFLAVVAQGMRATADLPLERAAAAAGAGLVGWIIVASIFGNGLI